MKRFTTSIIALFFIVIFITDTNVGHAVQQPESISIEHRIRTYVYRPNEVYIWTGHYGYQSSIELHPDETIQTIAMGDPSGWQISTAGHRIFLKPISPDPTTNVTLLTDQRTYLWEFHAAEATDINDENLVFVARFVYPEEGGLAGGVVDIVEEEIPDYTETPEKYNFNYTISGSQLIAPLKIFDDGEFTYFEFRRLNADLPAIFMVNKYGDEQLVNFRAVGNYIVVERVGQQYTLRYGDEVACVFNESIPLRIQKKKEKKILGLF